MLESTLHALGLSETEIKVYLALLPLGTVPASTVGLRLKIPRSTAKYTCEQLHKKGLISAQSKNNTFFYTAKEPEQLRTLLTQEKKTLEKKEDDLNRAMGSLKGLFREELNLPKVRFFEGSEGICKMFEDVIQENKTIFACLYADNDMDPQVMKYINEVYIPRRKNSKNEAWALFNTNEDSIEYRKQDEKMNRITLLVPTEEYPFDICFQIYGKKAAFYSFKPGNLVGVIIEDKFIQRLLFSVFKMAWDLARQFPTNQAYKKVELPELKS